jgi:hypothetical protein
VLDPLPRRGILGIGELFNVAQSLHALGTAYHAIATAEIGYRGLASRPADCLDDTITAARLVTGLAVNQELDHDKSRLLRQGIEQLRGHLLGTSFTARDAAVTVTRVSAARTLTGERLSGGNKEWQSWRNNDPEAFDAEAVNRLWAGWRKRRRT